MPTAFSAVLFDCDGILVDSEPITNGVLREMLQELGWDISEEECVRRFVGKAFLDEWQVIYEHTGHRIDMDWILGFRVRRNAALEARLTAVPGAVEAVREIVGRVSLLESDTLAAGQDTARRIPGARLAVIEGMGHDLPPGVVDRVLAPLLPHLAAHSLQAPLS